VPLHEPARVARPARSGEPACARHPAWESVGACARCKLDVCQTCRTRWRGKVLCVACVDRAFASGEAGPPEAQVAARQAHLSAYLAGGAWAGGLVGALLLSRAEGDALTLLALTLLSGLALVAAAGVGQALAALRGRTEQAGLAQLGLLLGGAYVGLLIGWAGLSLWMR
jgi:hypothetical protein